MADWCEWWIGVNGELVRGKLSWMEYLRDHMPPQGQAHAGAEQRRRSAQPTPPFTPIRHSHQSAIPARPPFTHVRRTNIGYLHRHMPAECRNLALEITDARLPGVTFGQRDERLVRHGEGSGRQPVLLDHLG